VKLTGALLALVERRAAQRRLDFPPVFHRDGQPYATSGSCGRQLCNAAGVARVLFQDLRRSAVRNIVRAVARVASAGIRS
jgi:hypothetical protein